MESPLATTESRKALEEKAHLMFVYNRLAELRDKSAAEDKAAREALANKNASKQSVPTSAYLKNKDTPSWLLEHNFKQKRRAEEEGRQHYS